MNYPTISLKAISKGSLLLALTFGLLGTSSALAQNKFVGSASCASSNCHGSVAPRNSTNVMQNEYSTWYRNGAHSQAYAVLKNEDSKIIGRHLGIKSPEKDALCLKCHATYVPDKSRRGPKYRLRDGVGCESCHGAAEKYLQPHTAKSSTHANNVKLGLIDLVSFKKRAEVCLECHHGTDDQTVNHRLIGAGHPRLTYELDTYGLLQPNHWEVDEDYIKRKAAYNSARAWMVGQVMRASEMLAAIKSGKRSKFGAMPELTLFYCYNCHHSLKEDQWKSRGYKGRPGELHLNASSMVMVGEALKALDPSMASSYNGQLEKLHTAYAKGNAATVVASLKSMLDDKILSMVMTTSFKKSVATDIMKRIATYASNNTSLPYESAEQCAMGISALAATVDPSGNVYQKKIDAMYDALKDEEGFQPRPFSVAAKALR